jgi:hypothetical protein
MKMARKFYTTQGTKKKLASLKAKRDKAYNAIADLAFVGGFANLPFSECKKLVPAHLVETLEATNQALTKAECDAVHIGQAWRGSFGMISFYS